MADGTKAVVDTSEADEAALAVAIGDTPDAAPQNARTQPSQPPAVDTEPDSPTEATAPLSTAEIAAELAVGAEPLADPDADHDTDADTDADTGTDTDADTGSLPVLLPAPLRHSGDKVGGRYRLEECITQSEAFSSWRAVDEKLRRAVGVHLLAAGHQRAGAVLAAAKAAALLGDPRFVQVLDAVQEGELVYVVREWLPEAADLAQLLADGPLEPYDAYQMVRQVTEAIAATHRRGQAHLRLTPRCVLRTDSGQYRINGIAVDAALRGLPTDDSELTDTRAVGALLYAALTHRWPYPEDRYDLQGLPKDLGCVPPDQVKAGVHKGLSELCARALCEQPPHHLEPITSPEQLAKAIALMPKVRQPEPPPPPAFTPPAFSAPRYPEATTVLPKHLSHPGHQGRPGHPGQPGRPDQAAPPRPRRRGRRRRLIRIAKWAGSAVALAAIGIGSWQLVTHLSNSTQDSGTTHTGTVQSSSPLPVVPSGAPLKIAGVQGFNALGDLPEHADTVGNTVDGNPDTLWQTAGYQDPFSSKWKEGTGLLVDLGSAHNVSSVHVQLSGATTVELRATPASTGSAPAASPSGLAVFGSSVAKATGTEVDLRPAHAVNTRYLLIWLTALPKDVEGKYQGRVAEIKVTG
ncbi:protein kinase family protein [Kitasatospora sp. McL0602]|uniref:protein kinase family protein n=1 Tax=Kitasatospora sp. McL0602 TaxID=3439530 RepID=UPI003F8C0D22